MKAIYFHTAGAIALTFGLAACIPASQAPAPTPPPVVTPAPSPTPTPAPVVQQPRYDNYLDAPQTPGNWLYFGTASTRATNGRAVYAASESQPLFMLTCAVQGSPQITLSRSTGQSGPRAMTIRTETTARTLDANATARRTAAYINMPIWEMMPGTASVTLSANDPLLDAMAITKGRFAVEVEGERTLYLPAWAEVSRVIEDCR